MVFPDLKNEMKVNGAWIDITNYSYTRDTARITRGRPDEWSQAVPPPSTLAVTMDGRDGRFSPRNPLGPYYGLLGRNQPIRASVAGDGSKACRIPGKYGTDNVSTPDASALHITTSIDIRVDATLANWDQYQTLAQRWRNTGTASSWILYLGGSGDLRFAWSTTGADTSGAYWLARLATTSYLNQDPGSRLAVRVTLDTTTGTVTFYTAPTISGSWTALTTSYTLTPGPSGATSIFAGSEPLIIGESGQARSLNLSICAGQINAVQVLNGIGGSAVANPDFNAQAIGATSFTDAAGRTWTLNGDCEITDRSFRFHGEASELPPRWDVSGRDVTVPLTAAGILRRLGQGTTSVASPLARSITASSTPPIGYWKCEETAGATAFASSSNARPMVISGSPSLASDTHIGGSSALASFQNSVWTATIPSYTQPSTNSFQVAFVTYLPTAPANGAIICRILSQNVRWDFGYSTSGGGGVYINAYDSTTGSLLGSDNSTSPFSSMLPLATIAAVSVQLSQTGSAIRYGFGTQAGGTGWNATYSNITSRTLGRVSTLTFGATANLTDTVLGHVGAYVPEYDQTYHTGPPSPYTGAYTGNAGETAGSRFVRLCQEQGVQPRTVGDPADSPAMGGQGTATLLTLLQQCVEADGGLMFEPRDVLGIGMRMRSSLFDETASVTLSHSGGQLSPPLEPTDDDQLVRNDWTVTNSNTGTSSRKTLDVGTLSTLDPPNGAGRYADTLSVNLQTDDLLDDLANWLVHVGTVDEQRFPSVTVQLENTIFGSASTPTSQAVQKLDIGQVIALTGMPSWMPPDDSRQLILGITETFTDKSWSITYNGAPASPYDILIWDNATYGRWDSNASTLHDATLSAGATSMQVDTAAGSPLWTTSGGDFPFDVIMAGERITVTNISGSSSPQTFTITRAVNGIAKAHVADEAVSLFRPFYWAPY
jgi:hypothetical protein